MMKTFLDFEQPVAELEEKIEELRHLSDSSDFNIVDEVTRLQASADSQLKQIYQKLSPWQKVQVARHPERPHFVDYIENLFEDFTPLAGDRAFAEDQAVKGGVARFRGYSCVVVGNEKGANTDDRVAHNFGMARPEGYRKVRRLMEFADRFHLPVISLVDTPGAYPGVGAEERGQAEAIARSIEACLAIRVPFVSAIIGEGGSGGAIAMAAANTVLMLEHAIYTLISPEGCASILWRSVEKAPAAAAALKLTADDLSNLGIIDNIVMEPLGGAHREPEKAITALGDGIYQALKELLPLDGGTLRARRRDKYLDIGKIGQN